MTSESDADFEEALAASEVATKAKLANAADAPRRVLEELKADSARANAFSVDIADLPARDVEESDRKEHVVAVPPSSASPRLPSRRIVLPESDRGNITLPDAHRIAALQVAGELEGGPTVGGGTLRVRAIETTGAELGAEVPGAGRVRRGRWILVLAIISGGALALYLAVSFGARATDRTTPSAAAVGSASGLTPSSSLLPQPATSAVASERPSSATASSTIGPSGTASDLAIQPPSTATAAPPISTPVAPPTAPRPGATPWFD